MWKALFLPQTNKMGNLSMLMYILEDWYTVQQWGRAEMTKEWRGRV